MESVGWIGRAFTSRLMEIYEARFIAAPYTMKDSYYEYDGKLLHAGMLNQGYELPTRLSSVGKIYNSMGK